MQLGDTLWKLAEKYNASFEELKKINSHLANPEKLMPGMKIKIPSSAKTVQKEKSKKEQMTPVSKEKTKTSTKEKTNEVKKEEKKKTEHPYKQKSSTPIAVLKEDDQKEKKKEQFEATMPKMPKVPSMPILEKETKAKQQPMKPKEPPKPKKEKTAPAAEQQPANKEEPKHPQALFNFEPQQEPMPCEPIAFIPPMPIMPMFYMPCPPMPYYDPCMVQPGMQQGFPMMPPMGDCGCGGQNQFPPMQAPFNGAPGGMGFQEEQQPAMNQQFNGMIPNQQRVANQTEQQQPTTARNNYVPPANNEPAAHQEADNGMFSPFNANHLSTSAPFMGNARNHQSFTENQHYMQPDQMPLSNPSANVHYPKPPFYPKLPEDKYDSNS